ncbi:MAG: 1,4-dihydroxy-2-naphthoate polyprenyltransferase [Clostridiales bacterium]|nr:1,4-dihydroxy-2-naphthoate polyprenyltransferase [Clostridiales bacterium]
MKLKSFLKLVEIQTKAASMVPFALGTFWALYRYDEFNLTNFLLMFVSLLCFDMATTAVNNYMDYKKARKVYGYNYEKHNAIVRYKLKESTVTAVILILLITASVSGFTLFLHTSPVVLAIGVLSFMVGIFYSFGPVPISRIPLGEVFSGFFMGFVIMFLSVFIHIHHKTGIILLSYRDNMLNIVLNPAEILEIFFVSLPAVLGIANIMLANNICDIEDDIENKRYTLPIYIGKETSLKLFKVLYYIAYADILILVLAGVLPLTSALVVLTFPIVNKNIGIFFKEQSKRNTFVLSVKNFLILNAAGVLALCIGLLL